MPQKKRRLYLVLLIAAPIMIELAIILFYTMSGGIGTSQWMGDFTFILPLVIVIGILIPVMAVLDAKLSQKKHPDSFQIPSKPIWALLIIFSIASAVGLIYMGSAPYRRSGDKAPMLFMLDGEGENGVPNIAVVTWTEDVSSLTLNWGTTLSMTNEPVISATSKSHGFLLPDLAPATTYFYQIKGQAKVYNFTTMAATPNVLKFGVSSDCHIGAGNNNKTATVAILSQVTKPANNFDMFFSLGDIVEMGNDDAQWKEYFDTFSPYTSSIPYRPAIGNHDTMVGGLDFWDDYFAPADLADVGPTHWAHIQSNGIHIFVMDLEWGVETYTDLQKQWFEAEMEDVDPNDWIVVMNHAMYYTSGMESSGINWADPPEMIELAKDFPEYGVDFVFSGHNHHMESLMVEGVSYSVVGSFGGHFDSERVTDGTGSIWYQDQQFGYAAMEFAGDTASVTYLSPENTELFSVELNRIR